MCDQIAVPELRPSLSSIPSPESHSSGNPLSGKHPTSLGLYIIYHYIAYRYQPCPRQPSLFPVRLSPLRNLGLCGYETSFRQFHSRLFPDRRFFYSLMSFEPEECVVGGQGEPEYRGDGHEEGFKR